MSEHICETLDRLKANLLAANLVADPLLVIVLIELIDALRREHGRDWA